MTDFSMLGLAEPILRAIRDQGYTNPTPIQAQVIPTMMEGRDIVGIAQTGTGKTAAFVLPILHHILNDQTRVNRKRCRALILTPTRELASQIAANVRAYGKHMRLSSLTVVGGVKPRPQIKSLERGVDIVIATPGRLLDHISSGAVKMDETTTVVMDEGDQMLDMGFIPAIRKIMQTLPRERQTLLMSATMPKQVRQLASDFLHRPKDISIGQASRPISRIEQSFVPVPRAEKRAHLTKLLAANDVDRAIVFTRTKHGADKVVRHLEKAGLSAAAIHGNKNQNQRQRALKEFKLGGVNILVATDIAARGIDIDNVSHVVNFELPNVPESYVHRIGRTARAGKSGVAISLYDPSERDLLRGIERLISREVVAAAMEGDEAEFTPPQRKRSDRNEAPAASGKKRRRSDQRKKNRRRNAKIAKRNNVNGKPSSTVHSRSQGAEQMRHAS